MAETENPAVRFYRWISEGFNAWSIFAASGMSGFVAWLLPFDWKTAVPWLLTVATFSGTWAVVQGLRDGYRKWRRWRHPGILLLTPDSGESGCIGIKFRGEPTTVQAYGAIVKLLNGSRNPSPHKFECRIGRGGGGTTSMEFHDGDWAHLVVGSYFKSVNWPAEPNGFVIHRGGTVVYIPLSGAVVRYVFRCNPPLRSGQAELVYQVTARWEGGQAIIDHDSSI